ncbi:uncharacterized protein EV420DRAFT_1222791, partial [Desarmillaria tabescens]
CKYCTAGQGLKMEGRDNAHIIHFTDPKKCPNAPAHVRRDARIYLSAKGGNHAITFITEDGGPSAEDTGRDDDSGSITASASGITATSNVIAVKRRKSGTLEEYGLDHGLTDTQKQRADVKLFRFFVHANIAFYAADDWYLEDFLHEIRPSYDAPSRYVL